MTNKFLSYLKQSILFNPSVFAIISPFFIARRGLYHAISDHRLLVKGKVLDVGCGRKPYKHLFEYSEYIGVDVENEAHPHKEEEIDVIYDGRVLPFTDNSFDTVICSQVLEHVFEPADFLQELNRVCKTGGILILTVPFMWGEHEQPNDAMRYSSFGIKHSLECQGFEIVVQRKLTGGKAVLLQFWNILFFNLSTKFGKIVLLFTTILNIPVNILYLLFCGKVYTEDDLFLDNFIVASKK